MNAFDSLLECRGTWQGSNQVWTGGADPVNESGSELLVTPVLRDTFIRLDQTWSWSGQQQCGSLLIGYARDSNVVTMHWIDTWHNGTRVMPLVGEADGRGLLVACGHFPVKDSADWGWRIEIRPASDRLRIDMFCLDPHGKEEGGWVRSDFRRR